MAVGTQKKLSTRQAFVHARVSSALGHIKQAREDVHEAGREISSITGASTQHLQLRAVLIELGLSYDSLNARLTLGGLDLDEATAQANGFQS